MAINDEREAWECLEINPLALRKFSERLKANEDLVELAVTYNGLALQYASKELRDNEDLVLTALQETSLALQYASEKLRGNRKIVLAALRKKERYDPDTDTYESEFGDAMQYASDILKANKEACLDFANINGFSLQHMSEEIRSDIYGILSHS